MKSLNFTPVLLTALLFIWTAGVYRYSHYGTWHIYPALLALPLIAVSHAVLIARSSRRGPAVLYAVVHICLLVPLWLGCLMLISKDSL
jgi:hypothetical protein